MNKSLLEQLPEIVRNGKRRAEQILESLEGKTRIGLQTRELVTPARDSNWKEFAAVKAAGKPGATIAGEMPLVNELAGQGELASKGARPWFNRLIYGDIIREFGRKLPELTEVQTNAPPEIGHRQLSEVDTLRMREPYSVVVGKCIYERLPYPSRNGEFEKAFIEKATPDGTVEAFSKINEEKHTFLNLRYVKESGLPGTYHPDFLARTATTIYLAETKGQTMLSLPDVERKRKAAIAWCDRINELPEDQRSGRSWSYALIGEELFYGFHRKGASLEDILNFARLRTKAADMESLL